VRAAVSACTRAPSSETVIRSSKKRSAFWFTLAAAAAALVVTAGGNSTPAEIESKQAEAEQVLAQIQQIDSDLDQAVDAYNGATERLTAIESELKQTKRHLAIARRASKVAQQNLADRVVALYVNGGDDSALEIILGAESIDDLLDRVDAAKRVSNLDVQIVGAVRAARGEIATHQRQLEKARAEQRKIVAERAAKRAEIERRLSERQRLYDSIKGQIAKLEAEERARQARLEEEAQRRLEEAQAAAAAEASGGGGAEASIPDAPDARYTGVVAVAMQYLGVPYVWAGASPSGFDCSGLVQYVFAQAGVSLPHNAAAQYGYGVPVSRDALQMGDLVFFDGLGHNGIYIGGGQFIHAPHTGDVVKISSLYDSWYAATYVGARRIF